MMGSAPAAGLGSARVAVALQAALAILVTLATLGFFLVARSLGGFVLETGDEGGPGLPLVLHGLGFSPVDAIAAVLLTLTILFWLWVGLDLVYVVRPLARRDLLGAEAPALLLGMLQLVFGGILPGIFLLVSSRETRREIHRTPTLEERRADDSHLRAMARGSLAQLLGRMSMAGMGVLWGIAGYFVFQNQFYRYLPTLIATASQGAPAFLNGWFHFWIFVTGFGAQPAVYFAGVVQLLLAFCLISGFARKTAYFGGILLATFLWIVPEAFGGPFVVAAFSLGPGAVYVVGLVSLIALDATLGPARATLDGLIETHFPGWARIAEVSVGLIPPIGRWYVRNSPKIARASELAFAALLTGSAAVAAATGLGGQLGALLNARTAAGPLGAWYKFWALALASYGSQVALGVIFAEIFLAGAFILGVARRFACTAGIGLVLFVWTVIEGFGGVPGPGYTDPGVGIAEAFVLVALLGLAVTEGVKRGSFGTRFLRRFSAWHRTSPLLEASSLEG